MPSPTPLDVVLIIVAFGVCLTATAQASDKGANMRVATSVSHGCSIDIAAADAADADDIVLTCGREIQPLVTIEEGEIAEAVTTDAESMEDDTLTSGDGPLATDGERPRYRVAVINF